MTKTEALNKLKEHGIELAYVTERPSFFEDAYDDSHEKYQEAFERGEFDRYNDEAIIPTKEQYNKIIDIVGEDGLYSIMKEYIKHGYLYIWSSSQRDASSSWTLTFSPWYSGEANWSSNAKSAGFSVALWIFKELKKK